MPSHTFNTNKTNLAYAKLVATPSGLSWSQAYNAGNLFVTVALEKQESELTHLQVIGKELFSRLESEFFTLEEKNLASIKQAVADSLENIPPAVMVDLCMAFVTGDILYLFIYGSGKIVMKRNEKIGILLDKSYAQDNEILCASGYLHNNDCVILQTKQFVSSITQEDLSQALDLVLPNDIAEALSPKIHETNNGGEAAVIITYHGPHQMNEAASQFETDQEDIDEPNPQYPQTPGQDPAAGPTHLENEEPVNAETEPPGRKMKFNSRGLSKMPRIRMPSLSIKLSHTKKLFISILIVIIVLLFVSIFLYKKKMQQNIYTSLFSRIYPQAQQDYKSGMDLESLNPSKAHGYFLQAQSLLQSGQGQFPQNSTQESQILALLQNVQSEITKTTNSNFTPSQPANVGSNDLLSIEKNTPSGLAFGQDDTNVYYITSTQIISVDKSTGSKKTIINNSNTWSNPVAIVPYEGNIYVLDKKAGVLKFVAGAGGFGESNYFKSNPPDESNAVGMAIDGSVWILQSDGTILKYTSGKEQSFQVTGLTQPFSSPTKIFTDLNTTSLYILDNGNSRVVQLGKDGTYTSQTASAVIQQAKDFEVMESNNQLLFLSNGTLSQVPLK